MNPAELLAYLRIGVGVGGWVAPTASVKPYGIDPADNPQMPYMTRLFAVRDLTLAVGVLRSKKKARRQWLELGVMCDALDAAASLAGGTKGYLSPRTTAMLTGAALTGTALGVAALRD